MDICELPDANRWLMLSEYVAAGLRWVTWLSRWCVWFYLRVARISSNEIVASNTAQHFSSSKEFPGGCTPTMQKIIRLSFINRGLLFFPYLWIHISRLRPTSLFFFTMRRVVTIVSRCITATLHCPLAPLTPKRSVLGAITCTFFKGSPLQLHSIVKLYIILSFMLYAILFI